MKCDNFLSSLETGGMLRRWLARRHVGRCVRCSQAAAGLEQLKRNLAEAAPLTRAERQAWMQAAGLPGRLLVARPRWLLLAGAAGMAAILIYAAAALRVYTSGGDHTVTVVDPRPTKPSTAKSPTSRQPTKKQRTTKPRPMRPQIAAPEAFLVDPAGEFARLNGEIDLAEKELGALLERAERLQASQQAAQMLADFRRW